MLFRQFSLVSDFFLPHDSLLTSFKDQHLSLLVKHPLILSEQFFQVSPTPMRDQLPSHFTGNQQSPFILILPAGTPFGNLLAYAYALCSHRKPSLPCFMTDPMDCRLLGGLWPTDLADHAGISDQHLSLIRRHAGLSGNHAARWPVLWDAQQKKVLNNSPISLGRWIISLCGRPFSCISPGEGKGDVDMLMHLINEEIAIPSLGREKDSQTPTSALPKGVERTLARLNDRLEWSNFLVGDAPCLADCYLFTICHLIEALRPWCSAGTLQESFPNIHRNNSWFLTRERILKVRHALVLSDQTHLGSRQ